jgi:hypothetical protein
VWFVGEIVVLHFFIGVGLSLDFFPKPGRGSLRAILGLEWAAKP